MTTDSTAKLQRKLRRKSSSVLLSLPKKKLKTLWVIKRKVNKSKRKTRKIVKGKRYQMRKSNQNTRLTRHQNTRLNLREKTTNLQKQRTKSHLRTFFLTWPPVMWGCWSTQKKSWLSVKLLSGYSRLMRLVVIWGTWKPTTTTFFSLPGNGATEETGREGARRLLSSLQRWKTYFKFDAIARVFTYISQEVLKGDKD